MLRSRDSRLKFLLKQVRATLLLVFIVFFPLETEKYTVWSTPQVSDFLALSAAFVLYE